MHLYSCFAYRYSFLLYDCATLPKQSVQVHGAEVVVGVIDGAVLGKQSVQVYGAEVDWLLALIASGRSNLYKCTEQKMLVPKCQSLCIGLLFCSVHLYRLLPLPKATSRTEFAFCSVHLYRLLRESCTIVEQK